MNFATRDILIPPRQREPAVRRKCRGGCVAVAPALTPAVETGSYAGGCAVGPPLPPPPDPLAARSLSELRAASGRIPAVAPVVRAGGRPGSNGDAKLVRRVGQLRPALAGHRRPAARRGRILDMACGCGTFLLYGLNRGRDVVGIEPEPWKLRYFRTEGGTGRLPALGTCPDAPGGGRTLPFADASFDLVTTFQTLEHVADVERCIARDAPRAAARRRALPARCLTTTAFSSRTTACRSCRRCTGGWPGGTCRCSAGRWPGWAR